MTLVEFLAPLGSTASYRDKCLVVMYYEHRYKGHPAVTGPQVLAGLVAARVPKAKRINVADVLARAGAMVDLVGREGGRILWRLTDTGEARVRSLLGLPETQVEIEFAVGSLTALSDSISDTGTRGYVEEAITCVQAGALRAAVVFLWSGAIRILQEDALAVGVKQLNAAVAKQDPKARQIKSIDDFAFVRDRTQLLAFREVGIIDKSEHDTLLEALNLRNKCGHPARYKPRQNRVSSMIEDVVGILFES